MMLVLIFTAICICASSYRPNQNINHQRIKIYNQYCQSSSEQSIRRRRYSPKNQDINDITQVLFPMQEIQQYKLFTGVVQQDFQKLYGSLNENPGSQWANFITLYIGGAIFVIMAPIFMACVCCPRCFKTNRQKPRNKFSICCTNCMGIICSLILMSICIVLIIHGISLRKDYNDFKCSVAIFMDDLQNGNFEDINHNETKYFAGVTTFKKSLPKMYEFIPDLQNITQQFQLESDITTKAQEILQSIQKLANKTGGPLVLQYGSPIQSQYTYYYIKSLVPSYLGSKHDQGSAINRLFTKMSKISTQLNNLSSKSQNLKIAVSQFADNSVKLHLILSTAVKENDKIIFKISQFFQIFQKQGILLVVQIVFFGVMGLLILMGLMVIVFSCCNIKKKKSNKNCQNCTCILFWIIGLLLIFASFILSIGYPAIYYGSKIIEDQIQQKQFVPFFTKIFPRNDFYINQIAGCLNQNQSTTLSLIANNQFYLQQFADFEKGQQNFTKEYCFNDLKNESDELTEKVTNYRYSFQIDINDYRGLKSLQRISDSKSFDCDSLENDKWVVSQSQCANSYIVNNRSCSSSSFLRNQTRCRGCIITMEILEMINEQSNLQFALGQRYPDCFGYDNFNHRLLIIWQKYYQKKMMALEPIRQRSIQLKQKLHNFDQQLNQNLSQTISTVQNQLGFIKDLSAGISCQVIGDDFLNSLGIISTQFVQKLFIIRILIIVMAFITIIIVICMSCSSCLNDFDRVEKQKKVPKKKIQLKQKIETENYFNPNPYFTNNMQTDRDLKN